VGKGCQQTAPDFSKEGETAPYPLGLVGLSVMPAFKRWMAPIEKGGWHQLGKAAYWRGVFGWGQDASKPLRTFPKKGKQLPIPWVWSVSP
jgi:hypothetical protein